MFISASDRRSIRATLLLFLTAWAAACRPTPPPITLPNSGIAFVSDRDGNQEIYVMQPDGSGLTRITDNPALDTEPAWSPDGKQIAFRSKRDGSSDIFLLGGAFGQPKNLINDPQDSIFDEFKPAWNPDGQRLAIYADRYAQDGCAAHQLAFMPVSGGSENIQLAQVAPGNQISFAWSPDGQALVFSAYHCSTNQTHLYIWEQPQSPAIQLTGDSVAPALYPAWSHDGHFIAFTSLHDGEGQIYVIEPATGLAVNLTNNPARDAYPTWSPDDSQIAFVTDRDGNDEIYIMNADGSEPRNITSNPAQDTLPAWSPVK